MSNTSWFLKTSCFSLFCILVNCIPLWFWTGLLKTLPWTILENCGQIMEIIVCWSLMSEPQFSHLMLQVRKVQIQPRDIFLMTHETSKVFPPQAPSFPLSTFIIKHAIVKKPPLLMCMYCNESIWELVVKGIWANIIQVCICMAGIVSGWVMVRVNGGRERLLVDIPPIEKVERAVLMVRERPHIRVDFLTVWNSIDKSAKTQPYVRVIVLRANAHSHVQYIRNSARTCMSAQFTLRRA